MQNQMITKKEKTIKVTDKVYCDSCNAVCTHHNYGHDYAEISAVWGYNSKLDGVSYEIHLCENCFLNIIKHLQTRRTLWAKDDSNNPLYGSLKYHQ